MANKEYIERLEMVIRQLHKADAVYSRTEPVKEVFQGKTVWDGEVEVFNLTGHPKAKRCYAWSTGSGNEEKFTAVLEIPPVESSQTAVKASILSSHKKT